MLIFMGIAGVAFGLSMAFFMETEVGLLFTLLGGVGIFFPLFDNISRRKVGFAFSVGLAFLLGSWTSFGAVKLVEQVISWSQTVPKEIAAAYRERQAEAEFRGSVAEESGQLRLKALAALQAKNPDGYKSTHPLTYQNHAPWPELYDFSSNEDFLTYAAAYKEGFLQSERMLRSWGCLELGWVEHNKYLISQKKVDVRDLNKRSKSRKWNDTDALLDLSGDEPDYLALLKRGTDSKAAACYEAAQQIYGKLQQTECNSKKCLRSRWCSVQYEQAYFLSVQKDPGIASACEP